MDDFGHYFKAFKEIFLSTLNIAFWGLDALLFAFSLLAKSVNLPSYIYLMILIAGFVISAIRIIADKNSQIFAYKNEVPVLGLYLKRNQIRNGKKVDLFRVRNLWTKLIKNVEIKPITAGGHLFVFNFKLDGTNILKPDEERDLIHNSNREIGIAAFDPNYATANFSITINFSDANNNKYQNIFNLGKSGVFLKASRRID